MILQVRRVPACAMAARRVQRATSIVYSPLDHFICHHINIIPTSISAVGVKPLMSYFILYTYFISDNQERFLDSL